MTDDAGSAGFDDWMDALEAGDPYYIECANGHGSLPPRRICPECGEQSLSEEPLPDTGTVETFSTVHVPTPAFQDDAPYVTAIVDFGPVRVTGRVLDVAPEEVEHSLTVSLTSTKSETTDDRLIAFEPV
ncbi:Zn-ribbon domain-containing OB-fold protein [Halovivax gelatinilyticus]|uniref:Zn-ribbon domain-containing OB-fold protein n=1 Tax=Halovivax gelatinilyticus TaxID=2961597 RepID=UPI0020CA3B2F|nr:OB-fold domain-containing protein [Halovivax gelatinilyticus]